jgi:UDP-4-amino-4,6-dideoxy-N-acetyl-beta-L-altrosamine transaminase
MNNFYPYSKPSLDDDDIEAVIEVLKSDWLTSGPSVDKFELALSSAVNCNHSVACSNGTAALHLVMMALDLTDGDVVLVPAITFLSSANAVRFVGAEVAWIDVDPQTGLITEQTLLSAIKKNRGKNLKAIINVHMAGQCNHLESIYQIANENNLWVIEDAAHAIGTTFTNSSGDLSKIGSNTFSDLTTFSFHAVKNIVAGEGGAVTTNNPQLAEKLKSLRCHGMTAKPEIAPWYYEMTRIGYNYRITDFQCALALNQLNKLELFKQHHKKLVHIYNEVFSENSFISGIQTSISCDPCWHLYVSLIDFENIAIDKVSLITKLKDLGIGTQVHYIPLYKQPYYKERYGDVSLIGAETYYQKALSLPLYHSLNENDCYRIAKIISENVK